MLYSKYDQFCKSEGCSAFVRSRDCQWLIILVQDVSFAMKNSKMTMILLFALNAALLITENVIKKKENASIPLCTKAIEAGHLHMMSATAPQASRKMLCAANAAA